MNIQAPTDSCSDMNFCPPIHRSYNLSHYEDQCPHHKYTIRIIERRPLIIYIEQFLTRDEIQHLIDLANPMFVPSAVVHIDGSSMVNDDFRSSSTAYLRRRQTPVVQCIEQRFAHFQGDIDPLRLEPLQVVRYESDQHFKPHLDWFSQADPMINGGQRISTFFTYLYANCTMGETEFLNVPFNLTVHHQLCHILTCDENSTMHGIRFRPIAGNSVFWANVNEEGLVDNSSFHAGLPPGENGHKLGLTTLTRENIFVSISD